MFHHLSRIDAKIPFDYSEIVPKHAPNHQRTATSGRLLENAQPIAQTVLTYPNVHIKYYARVLLIEKMYHNIYQAIPCLE